MKAVKTLYCVLCFITIFIFLYFFCYKWSGSNRNLVGTASIWDGYHPLVAYYEEHERVWDTKNCPKPPKSPGTHDAAAWQQTSNAKIFLYSAFFDSRSKHGGRSSFSVRVLGMSEGENSDSLYCQFFYANDSALATKTQQNEIWVKNWDSATSSQFYRPYLFSCVVPKDRFTRPTAVSIVLDPCENPPNLLRLKPERTVERKDFVVCLKPVNFNRDVSLRFLEWAELQFLLGADKISVYVYDAHPNISKVIEHYRTSGRMSVKYHVLPGREPNDALARTEYFEKNVWQKRRHEIIPFNDCFYEHLDTHRYVVILDLDEAIVPMMHDNWAELLEHVFSDHTNALQQYSSFSATNVYFFDGFGEYSEDKDIPPYMHMLRHVYRSANFSSPGFAVKSFHAINNTLAVFNHYTLIPLYAELRRNALIGRHLAQLHHYRSTCPPLMEKECASNFMKFYKKDTVMWKFKDPLIRNVKRIAQQLNLTS